MKKKSLLTTLLGTMLCLALIAFGVYAVSYLKLSVAGKINFISYDKYVYLESVVVKNYVETTDGGLTYTRKSKTLEDYSGRYLKNSEATTMIDISTLNVLAGESLVIEITMKSLSEDEIIIQCENNQVGGVTITYSETTLPSNPEGTPESGKSGTFVITISNASTGVVDMSSLSMNIGFQKVYNSSSIELLTTTTDEDGNIYHYVEMGQLSDGTAIRWRYMADINGTPVGDTKPTSLKGYYIIETKAAAKSSAFLASSKFNSSTGKHTDNAAYSNMYANDYATSDIRAYVDSENYLTDLGINAETDIIYNLITPRSMTDLYDDIAYDWSSYSDITAEDTNYGLSIAGMGNQTDKLWIPSHKEIRDMLCGGTWDNYKAVWGTNADADGYTGEWYWLRSSIADGSNGACLVDYSGVGNDVNVFFNSAVRAAFKIA